MYLVTHDDITDWRQLDAMYKAIMRHCQSKAAWRDWLKYTDLDHWEMLVFCDPAVAFIGDEGPVFDNFLSAVEFASAIDCVAPVIERYEE